MVKYICDNAALEKALKKLEALVVKHGGWLHEGLIIREEAGDISMESTLPAESRERLIFLPEETLVPLDQFVIKLFDKKLSMKSAKPEVTPACREIFETLLEVYNLTNKIETHNATHPWISLFTEPAALDLLIKGRPGRKFVPDSTKITTAKDKVAVILKSFFKTRYIQLGGKTSYLMPFVDFANHHAKAPTYSKSKKPGSGNNVVLLNGKVVKGSNQTFAHYNRLDAFDTYLIYGFADENASFVRSIPMTLSLGKLGKIEINSYSGAEAPKALAKNLDGLMFYYPEIISHKNNVLAISHLIFPRQASPHAFRRVLGSLIKTLAPKLPRTELSNVVKVAEGKILAKNIEYYNELLTYLDTLTPTKRTTVALKEARKMTNIQLAKLAEYKTL